MGENNRDFQQEYDSLNDAAEYQNNTNTPWSYIGTGRIPPTVSAPGNPTPLVVLCFSISPLFFAFGLFLCFSDAIVISSGLMESDIANKIISLIIMAGISLFILLLGIAYLKKAKKYYREKVVWENEKIDETGEDKMPQRNCPKCGETHDIDYPKCPNCKFNYLE